MSIRAVARRLGGPRSHATIGASGTAAYELGPANNNRGTNDGR